ncbi:hypothetical protein AMAG_18993 [Allomyces macrogynus ATCC 38327]|uniref:Uncharacterized protein n=1 Tax=Allomyces macrogynus (strain ATCC 38327) TaxID=578462 RepID=A0A0L0SLT2_ALLM3|nr:hypothetical protein AMAG_18993 [Allomyces macrogynus ATCC 38327]|eukprot:KNE63350.1 hypothetical protein AMAG_18993 [Allomyces macrogynus ATCC 38327]
MAAPAATGSVHVQGRPIAPLQGGGEQDTLQRTDTMPSAKIAILVVEGASAGGDLALSTEGQRPSMDMCLLMLSGEDEYNKRVLTELPIDDGADMFIDRPGSDDEDEDDEPENARQIRARMFGIGRL